MISSYLPSVGTLAAAAILSIPALIVVIVQAVRNMQRERNPPLPYPPGPKGEFLFGNARQMPENSQWLAFANWGKKYGEHNFYLTPQLALTINSGGYVFCRVFNAPYLILNDAKSAMDLLDRRSTIYSDRPVSVMANDL